MDLYRDCRFAKKLSIKGKPIICTYHGQDMRTRGVITDMDKISNLNLTSELDLLNKHPNINYLFLPFDTETYRADKKISSPLRVCHSPTNRYYKGSDDIIEICKMVKDAGGVLYGDGANLNALLGRIKPGDLGFDILHSNLHKTFTQPHGGGGPGAGAIMVSEKLSQYLPSPIVKYEKNNSSFICYDYFSGFIYWNS